MTEGGFGCRAERISASFSLAQVQMLGVYRTGLIGFWTGHQALKGATAGERRFAVPGLFRKTRHLVSVCPCLRGQRPRQDFKKTCFGRFPEAAGKLSRLIPSFPSRLIKEEIAHRAAAMTKRLLAAALIFQRALYHPRILHTTFPVL